MSSGSEFDFGKSLYSFLQSFLPIFKLVDAVSDNEEEKKKPTAFDDEDTVDAEALAKQKKEEEKKKQLEEEKLNAREKKTNKKDLDKLFEERQKKLGNVSDPKKIDTTGMTASQKAQALEQAAEKNLQNQLFGDDEEENKQIILTNDEEYKKYGEQVANVLHAGTTPYNIEKFYKTLSADIGKHTDYKNIKKIADMFTSLAATKLKEEKAEKAKAGIGKKEKVQLKGTGKAYEMNNNKAMINDVMGDYGDDDDDYGNEGGFTRENEAAYDFM